jgi:hypothetical protein
VIALIQSLITAASDAIMDEVDREFAPATTATRRINVGGYAVSLAPYDLRSVTTLTLHPETTSPQTLVAGTDYELLPVGAPSGTYSSLRLSSYLWLAGDTAYRMGHSLIDVNGAWGFATVPNVVNRACVLTVLSWIRRDISALGLSNEFDSAAAQPTAFGIPYEARRLLTPFYRLAHDGVLMARGSRISAGTGRSGGEDFNVRIVIEGAEKTSAEFKQIRRTINGRLREAMVRAGERSVLPAIKGDLPAKWGDTLFVKRDRGGVFIGSRLRGSMNRALGWYDFGGRRPNDSARREGPHAIVRGLQGERPAIDRAIRDELDHAFSEFETNF